MRSIFRRSVPQWRWAEMRLVVLDDDEAVATSMAGMAIVRGWDAQAVLHEAEFQALILAAPPDAILLDLQLGDSDGIEQLRFLQGIGFTGSVVLMSGFGARVLASARQIGESLGLSIAAAIEKPARAVRVGEVLAAIEQGTAVIVPPAADAPPALRAVSAHDVVEAIDTGRMELYLQPIVSALGHAVRSAEALIRWRDPVQGLVAPERFIAAAEQDAALIDRLTMWVAETGVTQHRRLAGLGLAVRVFINISGRSLRLLDFPDRIAAALQRMSAPPEAIGLEITESVAMDDLDVTADVLTRLRLKGFPVALDDFGTGNWSLTALRRLPFSAIKIDKSFVGEVETSDDSLTIVQSVIRLASDLGLSSVAEGVSSAGAAQLLADLGIGSLQGHYFSPPLPLDRFAAWLRGWAPGDGRA
jgi:EAL domain-containing protein (putative c-di-GMP-specific phosphodiesterase class I)/ActR/RegA family two-component response regulator